jgi:ABC-type antimicrobial peptide transport system permease subunit
VRLSVIGAIVGLLAVWLVPTLPAVKAILYDRPGFGPAAAAAAIAFVAAVIAGWFPARRASRIDPMLTLKSE